MEKKVATQHLKLGMYISKLDRPWLETPFLFQGFKLEQNKDIDELRALCRYVYIDTDQGEDSEHVYSSDPCVNERQFVAPLKDLPVQTTFYENISSLEDEMEVARNSHTRAYEIIGSVMDDVRAGKQLSTMGAREAVTQMVDSIVRNPDAFAWLTKLKRKDSYTYSHSIDSCTLMIAFGRHIGLPKPTLHDIAMGALFADVGKMRISNEILSKPVRLGPEEFEEIKKHVQHSVDIMRESKGIAEDSYVVVANHHERFNGSGYPQGLIGTATPIYGRMAAIVDCYDAITSTRPYGAAMSPHEAIRKLYEWRGVEFQEELIEHFIQCLGVYPTGTLVELSTGEVGIVISQNRVRRLRPKVMMILDKEKSPTPMYSTVDLATAAPDCDGNAIEIERSVDPDTYNIDPKEFFL